MRVELAAAARAPMMMTQMTMMTTQMTMMMTGEVGMRAEPPIRRGGATRPNRARSTRAQTASRLGDQRDDHLVMSPKASRRRSHPV